MRKDLKTGILLGVVPAIGVIIVMSVGPGGSVESRLRQIRNVGGEKPAVEMVTSDQDRVESVSAEPEPVAQRPVSELRGAAKELDGGDTAEIDQNSKPEPELPNAEDELPVQIHVVAGGQTLSSISVMYYGTSRQWRKILDANPKVIADQDRLRPGMRLVIPR